MPSESELSVEIRPPTSRQLQEAVELLCQMIQFPSISGQELPFMEFLDRAFRRFGQVERIPLSDALRQDPEYSSPIESLRYDERFNLRVILPGRGDGHLIINAHCDVVPPSEGMATPWTPRVEGETVFGRGACDDKGQIATLYLALRLLEAQKLLPYEDLVLHLVVEEENGGNGTLAMIRRGEPADACLVMEPSEGQIFTALRGALWFRMRFTGRASHSGQPRALSALTLAREAMDLTERFHQSLLNRSRDVFMFESFENPMPLTFGKLVAGNWPATVPGNACLEGVLGFLPNTNRDEVCKDLHEYLISQSGDRLKDAMELTFTFRHDGYILQPDHPLPRRMANAMRQHGMEATFAAMPASADAWLYQCLAGIPTILYGPGSLKHAHTREECINIKEIAQKARILAHFLVHRTGASSR